jgi:hypothetical protein
MKKQILYMNNDLSNVLKKELKDKRKNCDQIKEPCAEWKEYSTVKLLENNFLWHFEIKR